MQNHPPAIAPSAFSGLELLSSAVVLIDEQLVVRYLNPGAENLFATSSRKIVGQPLRRLLGEPVGLESALGRVLRDNWSYTGHNLNVLRPGMEALHLDCTVTPVEADGARLLLRQAVDARTTLWRINFPFGHHNRLAIFSALAVILGVDCGKAGYDYVSFTTFLDYAKTEGSDQLIFKKLSEMK